MKRWNSASSAADSSFCLFFKGQRPGTGEDPAQLSDIFFGMHPHAPNQRIWHTSQKFWCVSYVRPLLKSIFTFQGFTAHFLRFIKLFYIFFSWILNLRALLIESVKLGKVCIFIAFVLSLLLHEAVQARGSGARPTGGKVTDDADGVVDKQGGDVLHVVA